VSDLVDVARGHFDRPLGEFTATWHAKPPTFVGTTESLGFYLMCDVPSENAVAPTVHVSAVTGQLLAKTSFANECGPEENRDPVDRAGDPAEGERFPTVDQVQAEAEGLTSLERATVDAAR
jgi:hypothetical protein